MPKKRRFKIGDRVRWTVGRGKNKRIFIGKVTGLNPKIALGAKVRVNIKGETFFPVTKPYLPALTRQCHSGWILANPFLFPRTSLC